MKRGRTFFFSSTFPKCRNPRGEKGERNSYKIFITMLYLQKLIWNVFALFFHGNQKSPNQQRIEAWFGSRKTSAAIRTALSHVENLITGVSKGYRYKMRFVYAHFPINTSITNANKSIEIRNFLGEKKASVFDGESSRNLSKVMIGGLFLSSLKLLKSLMNMWVNLNAIKRLVEADALKMEIIPNPKDWSLHNP